MKIPCLNHLVSFIAFLHFSMPASSQNALSIDSCFCEKDKYNADLHAHVSLHSYNIDGMRYSKLDTEDYSHQDSVAMFQASTKGLETLLPKDTRGMARVVARKRHKNSHFKNFSQTTLQNLREGNVRLAITSFAPLENPLSNKGMTRLFNSWFKSKANLKWLKQVGTWDSITHHKNYLKEYAFFSAQKRHYEDFKWKFLEEGKDLDDKSVDLLIVNSLEGGHTFMDDEFDPKWRHASDIENYDSVRTLKSVGITSKGIIAAKKSRGQDSVLLKLHQIKEELYASIARIKDTTSFKIMFFVGPGHLVYNGMVGSALSIDDYKLRWAVRRVFRARVSNDPGIKYAWNNFFYNRAGVNWLGRRMIDQLLLEGSYPVLIDLKHSDYIARQVIIKLLEDRDLPIVCSHCPANGLSEVSYSPDVDEYSDPNKFDILYPFALNLFDEEVKRIHDSDGIMGIPMEERVLGAYVNPKRRKIRLKKSLKKLTGKDSKYLQSLILKYRSDYGLTKEEAEKVMFEDYYESEPFLHNLFHMVDQCSDGHENLLGTSAPWTSVCIGSDFDGSIDPIDICPTASQYPYFRVRLCQFIPLFLAIDKDRDYRMYFNKNFTVSNALEMVFYENLKRFTQENFIK